MSLEVVGLTKRFGGVVAVNGVDLTVPAGAVVGLIGPNGAGKTTLINLISGHFHADAGSIRFADVDVTRLRPDQRARRGIARTFQAIRLFKGLTVLENVLIGRYVRTRSDVLTSLLPFGRGDAAERDRSRAILERFDLGGRSRSLAGELSYGDQRRLEIARALAAEPRLLILDEPAAGMNAAESAALSALLRELAGEGLSVILIEHDVRLVMAACERVAVLNFGRKIAEGMPVGIQADPAVREAYLGMADDA